MRIFWDLFENGTIAKQYYERRCNERTTVYVIHTLQYLQFAYLNYYT